MACRCETDNPFVCTCDSPEEEAKNQFAMLRAAGALSAFADEAAFIESYLHAGVPETHKFAEDRGAGCRAEAEKVFAKLVQEKVLSEGADREVFVDTYCGGAGKRAREGNIEPALGPHGEALDFRDDHLERFGAALQPYAVRGAEDLEEAVKLSRAFDDLRQRGYHLSSSREEFIGINFGKEVF